MLQRGSDTVAQWLYLLIGGIGLVGIAWMCAGLCLVLLGITRWLGKAFERQQRLRPETGGAA